MTANATEAGIPAFDLADRMRKTLRHCDISVQDMADYMGVDRATVSTWINGRIVPNRRTLILWAMRTGVPITWLETGEVPSPNGDGTSIAPPTGLEPVTLCLTVAA